MSSTALTAPVQATDVLDEVAESVMAVATCDADAAEVERAYVRVTGPAREILDFCKHHYDLLEVDLLSAGYTAVIDIRAKLDPDYLRDEA